MLVTTIQLPIMTLKTRLRVGEMSNVIKHLIYVLTSGTTHRPTSGIKVKVKSLSCRSIVVRRELLGRPQFSCLRLLLKQTSRM